MDRVHRRRKAGEDSSQRAEERRPGPVKVHQVRTRTPHHAAKAQGRRGIDAGPHELRLEDLDPGGSKPPRDGTGAPDGGDAIHAQAGELGKQTGEMRAAAPAFPGGHDVQHADSPFHATPLRQRAIILGAHDEDVT